jgi:uncharacterized protein involved in exopolysaccharide biosynthesis
MAQDIPMDRDWAIQTRDLTSEVNNLKEKRREITQQIKVLQTRVDRTPVREQEMASLVRDYDNTRNNYQAILGKKLDAQLSENLEKRQKGEQFRVLDPANLPEKPIEPVPLKILLIGLALGLGTGVGVVLILEYFDSSFRRAEDVYQTVGIPVLATIPKIPSEIRSKRQFFGRRRGND